MKLLFYFSLFSFCLSANILAQNQATLQGKVTEAKSGDDAINAYIKLSKNGVIKIAVATDFEGNYSANVDPGTYDVEISYFDMATNLTKGVVLNGGVIVKLDVKLNEAVQNSVPAFYSPSCKYPLTKQDNSTGCGTITAEQLKLPPVRNVNPLVGLTANQFATLQGKVTEAVSGDEAINAYVKLLKNGITKATVATDFEGKYSMNMEGGIYDVEVSYVGMKTKVIKNVMISNGLVTTLDVKLEENLRIPEGMNCGPHYKIPLIQMDNMSSGATYSAEQIMRSPARNWFW